MAEESYQLVAFWAAVVICVLGGIAGILVWSFNFRAPWQVAILQRHYAAIMGLPAAAAGAFVLVTLFRQVAGQIKISLWGLQLEGAAGPVTLWVVCFLAMAVAIRMLWPLK